MRRSSSLRLSIALLAVCCTSCGPRAQISGTVTDGFGRPLPGAVVSIATTSFKTTTGQDGKYRLEYAPGTFSVLFAKNGFTSDQVSQSVTVATSVPLQDVILYQRPPAPGIWLMQDGKYVAVANGAYRVTNAHVPGQVQYGTEIGGQDFVSYYLTGTFTKARTSARYRFVDTTLPCDCLGPPATPSAPGETIHFDKSTRLTLFGLNEAGLLGVRVVKTGLLSRETQLQSMTVINEKMSQLEQGMTLREASLAPGLYAFVRITSIQVSYGSTDLQPAYPALILKTSP